MFDFDKKNELKHLPHDLSGAFPSEKPRYTMTEEVEHTAREMKNTIDRLLKFEKRLEEKFTDMLHHITSDNAIFKETFSNGYNQFLMEVKNEVNMFESNVDSSIALFKSILESDYATLSEDCKTQITEYYNNFIDELTAYKSELNAIYDSFRATVENRLEQYNSNYVTSFNNYTSSVNSKLATMESKFAEDYRVFVEQINTAVTNFKTDWARTIEERLDGQDAIINDALLYMRTNLTDAVENSIREMQISGVFNSLIEGVVFGEFNTRLKVLEDTIVTPEMFGGVADGETDITTAFSDTVANSGVIIIPKGVHVIRGDVTLNRTISIIGYGDESVLRIYGTIKTDSDSSHVLKLSNLKIENYNVTGNAFEVVKTNNSNAKNTFTADNVRFYANNNVSENYVSNTLYLKGVRESTINNCVFEGVSSGYGTAIKLSGDSDEITCNITITNSHFYNFNTAILSETDANNLVYLAGLRIVNNTFIGCTYGVKGANVDTMFILDNMLDYVANPVFCETVGCMVVRGNYLQTIREGQCIYLANKRETDISMVDISDNYMWCATDNKEANGIVLVGDVGKIAYSIIDKNRFNALNTCVSLTNCQGMKVSKSTAKNCNLFYNGNTSTIIDLYDNYVEATVTNFMTNFHASGKLNGNRHGVKYDHNHGKLITTATGQVDTFKVEHKLLSAGNWGSAHIGNSDMLNNPFAVTYDDTYIYFKFMEAPANNQTIVINWECAI